MGKSLNPDSAKCQAAEQPELSWFAGKTTPL